MRVFLSAVAAVALAGCASYVGTPRLTSYDLRKGYRFEQLPVAAATPRNSDELFVVLALSGGGTRAAALSYGVLAQLRAARFHWDDSVRAPVQCQPVESPSCRAMERSLLDEVDVISTVSGGSFTGAYFALSGEEIFDPRGKFHTAFLYHPVQSDLLKQARYYPKNWRRLRSRVEIAADYYARNIFGDSTFAALARRSRPYLVLNATDASTGARFEFTQEQFDLLCADLSQVSIARGVAASSAFPVLLNSMTIDSHNAHSGCEYKGPGSGAERDWVPLALSDTFVNYERYTRARQLLAYRDSTRKHLHLLDGGLADNLGLRSVLQSLGSTDRPLAESGRVRGGWSLLQKINQRQVKTIVVVSVDARTKKATNWDTKKTGPMTFSTVNASAGIPMGNFSTETLNLLRQYGLEAGLGPDSLVRRFTSAAGDSVCRCLVESEAPIRFYGLAIGLENVRDAREREFLTNVGTNFELTKLEVDCLISAGAKLLRESASVTEAASQSFSAFVQRHLLGRVEAAKVDVPPACSVAAGRESSRRHTVDVGLRYGALESRSGDVERDRRFAQGLGLAFRIAKPDGLGASAGVSRQSLGVPGSVGTTSLSLGRVRLYALTGGVHLSKHLGPLEASAGLSGGFALSAFGLSAYARERLAADSVFGVETEASPTWVAEPGVSLWWGGKGRIATTVAASYFMARPTLRFEASAPLPERELRINALRWSVGAGIRVF
jgi:predicted acylesterase/phospholipase RssA